MSTVQATVIESVDSNQYGREDGRVKARIKLPDGKYTNLSAPADASWANDIISLQKGQTVNVYQKGNYWNLSKDQDSTPAPHNGTVPAAAVSPLTDEQLTERLNKYSKLYAEAWDNMTTALGQNVDHRAIASAAATVFIETVRG